jgi:hypothetical protein
MTKFSDKVRERVRSSGLASMRVAKMASIETSHFTRFMNGQKGLSLNALDRLIAVLDDIQIGLIPEDEEYDCDCPGCKVIRSED